MPVSDADNRLINALADKELPCVGGAIRDPGRLLALLRREKGCHSVPLSTLVDRG